MPTVRVSALFIYPVKSCRGIRVQHGRVMRRGLEHDRRWMIVDARGRFLSQRDERRLALVQTAVDGELLVLSSPGGGSVRLPLEAPPGPRLEVELWRDRMAAIADEAASAWLSRLLARPCQLVFMPEDVARPVNPKHARPGDVVSFADAYPVLLTSEGSLAALNARLPAPIGMERFRPNVVVDAPEPFVEDTWRTLRLGALPWRQTKPCDRCVVPSIDPLSGVAGKEPLATLARFRAKDGAVWFGVNLVPDALGVLSVGDQVAPLELGPAFLPAASDPREGV